MFIFSWVTGRYIFYAIKANNLGAILLPQLEKGFTHPRKCQSMKCRRVSTCLSLAGQTPPPSSPAWTLCRGLRLLRLIALFHCPAPPPPGCSHSLIMINILLEAVHYRLPPKHLWFRTPDTSPLIPPG